MRRIVVLATLLLAGCAATPPRPTVFEDSVALQEDFDATWTAIIEVFADHNWAIANIEKASGLIVTDWLSLNLSSAVDYADCGQDWAGTPARTTAVKFNVFAKPAATGTTVRITCSFRGVRPGSSTSQTVDCLSKGKLEEEVITYIQEKLRSSAP